MFALWVGMFSGPSMGCASLASTRVSKPVAASQPGAQEHPLTGQVAMAGRGQLSPPQVAWSQLRARMWAADVVLLGETHDNAEHHRLQAQLLGELLRQGARPVVVFEMMDIDQQAQLDAITQRAGWRPLEVFAQLNWPARGWDNTDDYLPLLALAAEHGLLVVAANLSRAQMRGLFADGGASWSWAQRLEVGLASPLTAGQAAQLNEDLRLAHGGAVPPKTVAKMAAIQQSRDGQFARLLALAARGEPAAQGSGRCSPGPRAVLIAGRDHTRLDRAVPWHLAHQAAGLQWLSIALLEPVPSLQTANDYPQLRLHDAVVWTPH